METHLDATRITGPDACRRILLCGKDNPLSARPEYALYHEPPGCSGHRLQSRILGLPARAWYLPIWRTNLCVGGWDRELASGRAEHLLRGAPGVAPPWHAIVALGTEVIGAFERAARRAIAPFGVVRVRSVDPAIVRALGPADHETTIVALPHPSGRNPIWGDPKIVARARQILTETLPDVPWGEIDRAGVGTRDPGPSGAPPADSRR